MENASKALIIAGAILLSILIIGIGIYIYTSAQGTVDSSLASMTSQEVDAFNSQFTSYEGDEKSGTEVKALLAKLASNYGTYKDEPSKVPGVSLISTQKGSPEVYVTKDTKVHYTDDISEMRNAIINKHTYKVDMIFGSSGIIEKIEIKDVTK